MAIGWAKDGAAQDEIDALISCSVNKASKLFTRESLFFCIDCGEEIPQKRREAMRGIVRCIQCQTDLEA